MRKPCDVCYCGYHCNLTDHGGGDVSLDVPEHCAKQQVNYVGMLDRSWESFECYETEIYNCLDKGDTFMSLLCALNTDLDGCDVDL